MAKSVKTKKKKSYKNAKLILLFSVTFVVALFIISVLIKNYSPTVDVNIGGEEIAQEEEPEEEIERGIDDRLKWIQFEDNMTESPVVSEVQNYSDSHEKLLKNQSNINKILYSDTLARKDKKNKNKAKNNINREIDMAPIPIRPQSSPPIPTIAEVQQKENIKPVSAPERKENVSVVTTKVYIGFYPTPEEANEVKNQLAATVPGYQPFVKKSGNNYIVQVGSFTDRTKAVNVKLNLSDKGYPARLLTE